MNSSLTVTVTYKKEHIVAVYRARRTKFCNRQNIQHHILPIIIAGGLALFFTYKADTDYATGYVLGLLLSSAAFLLLTIYFFDEYWAEMKEIRSIQTYVKNFDKKTETVECTDSTISVHMEEGTVIVKWETSVLQM